MASTRGRQVVLPLTNKSGGGVVAGDVVIVDTGNDAAFTTTTTGAAQVSVGVAQETIANNATGRVLVAGYAALINVPASVTRGHYIKTHTVAKQATGNSTRQAGSFGQFLTGGTTPTGWLWGFPDNAGASGETVATSTIWDAAGDLAVGSGADTAAKLTLGTTGQALVSNGTTAVWGRPKGTPVDFGTAKRTAGDVACTADAVWTEVDSGLRITIDAATSDRVEFGVSIIATSTDAVSINFTVMSFVSAALTNDLFEGAAKSDTTNGVSGWRLAASTVDKACGGIISPAALQAGDISGGTLVATLCYRTSSSTNRTIRADTTLPLMWWIRNLGPAI